MPAPLAQPAQWNLFCSYSIGVDVYPVECLPRAMLLAFHCTGAFPYSTGEFEVNIPSGLNFSQKTSEADLSPGIMVDLTGEL